MATREIAGKTVQVDGEGFMTDPNEWNKEIAKELAKEEGIPELTPAHWTVVDFCRQDASPHHNPSRRLDQGPVFAVPKGTG
jgi:TusE/DsrC/DsvC family sulfur relay protein